MATEHPSAGDTIKIFHEGEWHELIIRTRFSSADLNAEMMAHLTVKTVGTWLRAWQAIRRDIWKVEALSAEMALAHELSKQVSSVDTEPFVTVFNKNYSGLSITVHSSENGQGAVNAALALAATRDELKVKMPQLFEASAKQASKPAKPDIDNVDDFIPPYSRFQDEPESQVTKPSDFDSTGVQSLLPFRKFKQQAPNIITIQEFKKGGNGADEYKKMALIATLPYHKTNPQYDDNSMIYMPITGALQIVEGQYGIQAVIPTEKGRVYVDMKNKNGQESPDWFNFSQDLGAHYSPLLNDKISQFFAPNCILVLRVGATKDGKQYKNFQHIYQPLAVAAKA